MAFPTVNGTPAEDSSGTATTAPTFVISGSIVAGELLLLFNATGGSGATQFNAITGWTELIDENASSGMHIWYRWADGLGGTPETSPLSATCTVATHHASICMRIGGAENPSTQAPQISAVATGTSNAPNPNTVTPTGGAKDYLWITCFAVGATEAADTDTYVNNAATGYGNLLQKTSGTGGVNIGAILGLSRKTANAASDDAVWPAASLDASAAWRAFTIAIHPPGAAVVNRPYQARRSSARYVPPGRGTFN